MRELKRYFFAVIFQAIAAVVLVFLVLSVLSDIIDQMGDIQNDYTFVQVLICTLWRVPGFIESNMAFSAMVGSLVGLGMLASSNELTIVRSSGVSVLGVVYLVMRPVLLIVMIGLVLGELAPHADRIADGQRALALGGKDAKRFRAGKQIWNRDGNDFIRFNTVLPNGKVYGMTRYRFDDSKQLFAIQFAEEGTFERQSWLLEEVKEYHYEANDVTSIKQFKTLRWQTSLTPDLLTLHSSDPDNLTLRELLRYSEFLNTQALESGHHRLAFWKKIFSPMELLSLVLVAISAVFGPLRQASMGYRVFVGVIIGVVFKISQDVLTSSSLVFGFSPLLGVLMPITLCMVIGLLVIQRVR